MVTRRKLEGIDGRSTTSSGACGPAADFDSNTGKETYQVTNQFKLRVPRHPVPESFLVPVSVKW